MNHVFILSGPSGVGKDTVVKVLKKAKLPIHFATTVTTRPKRAGEVDNEDYYFVSEKEFEELKNSGRLIEWAQVYGSWYGVPKEEVERGWREGKGVFLKVDIQGARTLKKLFPQAVLIFLSPPDFAQLSSQLQKRNTESKLEQELRLKSAIQELASLSMFDHNVVNIKPEEAAAQIEAIIRSYLG